MRFYLFTYYTMSSLKISDLIISYNLIEYIFDYLDLYTIVNLLSCNKTLYNFYSINRAYYLYKYLSFLKPTHNKNISLMKECYRLERNILNRCERLSCLSKNHIIMAINYFVLSEDFIHEFRNIIYIEYALRTSFLSQKFMEFYYDDVFESFKKQSDENDCKNRFNKLIINNGSLSDDVVDAFGFKLGIKNILEYRKRKPKKKK